MTRWLVVGGGSAGSVVAARLSADETNEVVLVEAGPDHGGSVGAAGEPVLDRPALLLPELHVVRRPGLAAQPYAQGFGLGGSSLVNGGVVVGDLVTESAGHELPLERASAGSVGSAVLALTQDASRVGLVARSGRRVSAAEVYLDPVRDRENLQIATDSPVDRLALDDRRCEGVVTVRGEHLAADRVVLCAGAIATPVLLLRSGVDTPGVGADLEDHAGVTISFDVTAPGSRGPAIAVTVERPNRQIVVMERIPGRPETGAVIAGHLATRSRGSVSSTDPDAPPFVRLDQLDASEDLDGLVEVTREALALLREVAATGAIGDRYVDRHGTNADELDVDDAALRSWVSDHLGGYHHVAGSCRIGGPLDADGRLIGYDGVFVADAAALPGVPQRNPYLAVVRQAERFARRWCRTRPGS